MLRSSLKRAEEKPRRWTRGKVRDGRASTPQNQDMSQGLPVQVESEGRHWTCWHRPKEHATQFRRLQKTWRGLKERKLFKEVLLGTRTKKKTKNKVNHKLIKWCKVLPSWNAEGELFGLASILPEGQMLSAGMQEWQSVLELVAKPDWKRRGRHRYTNSVYPTPPCRWCLRAQDLGREEILKCLWKSISAEMRENCNIVIMKKSLPELPGLTHAGQKQSWKSLATGH